jgi:hypothetical protein
MRGLETQPAICSLHLLPGHHAIGNPAPETDLHPAKHSVEAMKFLKQFPAGHCLCFRGNIQPDFMIGVAQEDEAARLKALHVSTGRLT